MQLAKRLGVSQALVSRALSGRAVEIGASSATVARIIRAAAEVRYQPNPAALALLGSPTCTLGIVVKRFDDPFLGQLIGALQALARTTGHSLILTGGSAGDLDVLQKHAVDGVILAGSGFQPGGLREMAARGIPVVRIGAGAGFPGSCLVRMDEVSGVGDLVKHLAGLGHTRVGFAGCSNAVHKRRAEFVRRALKAAKLPVRTDDFFLHGRDPIEAADYAKSQLLKLTSRPTALIAAEDDIALPMLRLLHDAGMRVPGDMSLVGIDNIPSSAHSIPPLTTLRQPIQQLAAAAFKVLTNRKNQTLSVLVRGELIIRASTAEPSTNPPS